MEDLSMESLHWMGNDKSLTFYFTQLLSGQTYFLDPLRHTKMCIDNLVSADYSVHLNDSILE